MSSEVVAGPLLSSLSVTTNDSDLGVAWRQMKPAFDPRTLHYAVGCQDVDTMSLTFSAQDGGSRLAVEGAQVTNSGAGVATTAEETLYYGATVRVMVAGADGGTTTYVVHCIPAGMDEVTTVKRATSGVTEDLIMFARREQQHVYMLMIDNNGVPATFALLAAKGPVRTSIGPGWPTPVSGDTLTAGTGIRTERWSSSIRTCGSWIRCRRWPR